MNTVGNLPSRRTVLKRLTAMLGAHSVAACGGGGEAVATEAQQPTAAGSAGDPQPISSPPPAPVVSQPVAPAPPPPAVAGGTWQRLNVAPHSRKLISESFATGSAFDPTVSLAVDARAPITVAAIPWRSFCRPVMGEPGVLYYMGSLHSNYPGNEIDRIDLRNLASSEITTTINHQPRVPPQGTDSGYGAGSSAFIYAMYGTPLVDKSLWQPYAHHTWTKNGWHPSWGWFSQITYALNEGQTVGASPAGTGSQYQQASAGQGLVSYQWQEGKYRVRLANAPGKSGASDWNQHRMSLLFLETDNGSLVTVSELLAENTTANVLFTFDSARLSGNKWGFAAGPSGNGILVKWLESSKYLCLRIDSNREPSDPVGFDAFHTLFLLNPTDPDAKVRRLIPPAGALAGIVPSADGNMTFCVDRNSRRVFWLVFKADSSAGAAQFVRLYFSGFDDLTNWTEITTSGLPEIVNVTYQSTWLASKRETLWFYNGYLFIALPEGGGANDPGFTNGALNLYRMKVETSEDLPAFNFNRYDYAAQNFRFSHSAALQLIGTKHVSWAYRSVDDTWYQCAGDFGESFCNSMGSVRFDGSARGYTFAEVLSELSDPPAGTKRPASPDDGHWQYLGSNNANADLRDKFLFARGGDGTGILSNIFLRAKFGGDENSPSNIAAARARGWDNDKLMLFDPKTRTFNSLDTETWTQVAGGNPVYDGGHMGDKNGFASWRTRCGIFDASTNTLFRFVDQQSLYLTAWNLDRKTIHVYQTAVWTDPDTGRIWGSAGPRPNSVDEVVADGFGFYNKDQNRYYTDLELHWEHKAMWIDSRDGKLYCVAPKSGVLWCFETRNPTITADGKASVKFYPVGKRMPIPKSVYVGLSSLHTYPPVRVSSDSGADARMNSCLLPFKGGLLWQSNLIHTGGVAGEPTYAFWRRLGDLGAWSVVTMPQEYAANSMAAKDPTSINNAEILAISQAYTDIEDRQFYRYFWRIT